MIDTTGMITVAEAARRLNRSQEQVRRNLRDGKLKGQHIGNQWFVDEACLAKGNENEFRPLIPFELQRRIRETRERIYRRNGTVFDVVEMVRETREGH